jgi:protein involved in polysaccharide export with SLBB domain
MLALLLAGLAFGGSSQGAAQEAPPAANPLDNVHLQTGDKLIYSIAEDPKAQGPEMVPITSLGIARFKVSRGYPDPAINIDVKGKTVSQVKAELKAALDAEYYMNATVDLQIETQAVRVGQVFLTGEIQQTTIQFDLVKPKTLFDAIMEARPSEYAQLKRVKVLRINPETKTSQEMIINVDIMKNRGDRRKDITLEHGDVITVPQKTFNFR